MNNPNEREIDNKEVRQESYTDDNGNRHTHVTRTTSTDNNSYQSGYVHGRNTERRYQQADLAERDENTASGLLLGVLLTSLIGLTVGAFWYFNQQNAAVDSTTPVETPASTNVTPTPTATITAEPQQTTIIERTREVPVVIPQPSAPTNPQINLTVPPQQSRTETSPSVAPSNVPSLNNRNNTSTQTPATSSTTNPTPQGEESNSSSSSSGNTNQNTDSAQ